jgi:hypothetical protein
MKRLLFAAVMTAAIVPARAAEVGVSVGVDQSGVDQSGVYGRIDVPSFPQPQVIYPKPIVIHPVAVSVEPQPLYLHVPPGHAKNWRKHCHKYDACGQPVYFVQERWYNEVYVPQHRDHAGEKNQHHDEEHGHGHGHGHGNGNKES